MAFLKQKHFSWSDLLLFSILLVYALLKANAHGDDISAYIHASRLLFEQQNIYASTDLYSYEYSPLFAYLLYPLSILPLKVAKIVWAVINFLLLVRLWLLSKEILLANFQLSQRFTNLFTFFLLVLSFDSFNNNLLLGQVTLLILWLSIEGLQQILVKNKPVLGALLIALGINIKIIPVLALFYLLFKQRFLAVGLAVLFLLGTLAIPSLLTGHQYNVELLSHWKEKTPFGQQVVVFDSNNNQHSLSNILPAYFHDFASPEDNNLDGFKRKISYLSDNTLTICLQASRVLLLLSFLGLIFYRRNNRQQQELYIWWEIAYLLLVSFMVFPNQPRYALFYFFPTCAYLLLFVFLLLQQKNTVSMSLKTVAIFASFSMLLLAIMGRDLIGSYLINLLDFYHVPGFIFILGLILLQYLKPDKLLGLVTTAESS